MKETGLMFKAPLVRAILSGQKTQTRRVMKLNFNDRFSYMKTNLEAAYNEIIEFREQEGTWFGLHEWNELCSGVCPFGQPGDRIYVRETFARVPTVCGSDEMIFAADYQDGSDKAAGVKYTPAIHMFKEDARIWLEVTGVRAERLQDISEADAAAEGCETVCMTPTGDDSGSAIYGPGGFAELWDSTTGRPALPTNTTSKRYARIKQWLDTHPDTVGWAANPWVWVIDFKCIEKP